MRRPASYVAQAVEGIPEVVPSMKLGRMLANLFEFQDGDVLVLAQKVVSKAEDRLTRLDHVRPTPHAMELGEQANKDPRLVQLLLDESREILRVRPGVIIVEDRRGWVCANAGIDRSNIVQADGHEVVCLLPIDPDASAQRIREELYETTAHLIGVIIADSHGRAWRDGTIGVAIGTAGIEALSDRRGRKDRTGYELQHTLVGTADELASAASLLMGQGDEGLPAVVLRGLEVAGAGKATDLQRSRDRDLFR